MIKEEKKGSALHDLYCTQKISANYCFSRISLSPSWVINHTGSVFFALLSLLLDISCALYIVQ